MKRHPLVLILSFLTLCGYSQDLIQLKTGEELSGKVLEIRKDTVDFQLRDPDSVISIAKLELSKLRYNKGVEMVFEEPAVTTVKSTLPVDSNGEYARGVQDAEIYYTRYKSASTGTLVAGIIFPVLALVPAIACSSKPPLKSNLDIPDPLKNTSIDYYNGYSAQAGKIKSKKVWKGYGIGAGVGVGIRVIYVAAVAIIVSSIAFD